MKNKNTSFVTIWKGSEFKKKRQLTFVTSFLSQLIVGTSFLSPYIVGTYFSDIPNLKYRSKVKQSLCLTKYQVMKTYLLN